MKRVLGWNEEHKESACLWRPLNRRYICLMGKHGGANKERSFARVLKQAAERSKIQKIINVHALRHSLAIHL